MHAEAVLAGDIAVRNMLVTWFVQTILIGLFAGGFHFPG
jgi:hypothetical protein